MIENLIHVWRWRGDRTLHTVLHTPRGSLILPGFVRRHLGINKVGIYGWWLAPATLVGDYAEPLLVVKPSRKRFCQISLQFPPDPPRWWIGSWQAELHGELWFIDPGIYSYRVARLHKGWVRNVNDRETV
jgi:hypothetical protein